MRNKFLILLFFFICSTSFSQQESTLMLIEEDTKRAKKEKKKKNIAGEIDPLSPARAAFYSAVVPGLGQAYNKKYWKIPIVYAGMGAGIYFYLRNNKQYNRYRDAYKRRLAGFNDDEFSSNGIPLLSDQSIIDAQKFYSRNKEVSLLVTVAIYILNIVDANVDAHLMQFNVNEDLSVRPDLYQDDFTNRTNLGLSLNYQF